MTLSAFARKYIPALQRLRDSVVSATGASAQALSELEAIHRKLEHIESEITTLKQKDNSVHLDTPEDLDKETSGLIRAALQTAAVQHLPLLPYEIDVTDGVITVQTWAAAPLGLTENMRFFVNGKPFDQVEYPIRDEELSAKFADIRGCSFVAKLLTSLPDPEAKWIRLDAAPTGIYNECAWRKAIHILNPMHERYPFPPEANKLRVIGDAHETRFKMGGATIFKNMERYLQEALALSWSDFPSILDWGCGSARVSRYLIAESGQAVTGADIDPDNVAWCKANIAGGRFETIPLMPRTQFKDGQFDLAIGVSVFTHLKEDVQFAWLEEMRRVIKPGGYALFSITGPTQFAYNRFPAHLYEKVQHDGFMDLSADPALNSVLDDKEYYRSVMHSRDYICDRWTEYFDVIAIEDGIAALQDFVVLRRRH